MLLHLIHCTEKESGDEIESHSAAYRTKGGERRKGGRRSKIKPLIYYKPVPF